MNIHQTRIRNIGFVLLTLALGACGTAPQRVAESPAKATESPNCLKETGSRLPPPEGQCLPVQGRAYDRQDLERSGGADVGESLNRLGVN